MNLAYSVLLAEDHKNIDQVANLHKSTFPSGILEKLGESILCQYYIHQTHPETGGIIAAFDAERVVAYLAYVHNRGHFASLPLMRKIKKQLYKNILFCKISPITLTRAWIKKRKSNHLHDIPELTAFAVNPQYRRMGIGRELLSKMESKLSENGHNAYCVFTDNPEGIRFYKKYHFETVFQFRFMGVESACFTKKIEKHHSNAV